MPAAYSSVIKNLHMKFESFIDGNFTFTIIHTAQTHKVFMLFHQLHIGFCRDVDDK